MPKPFGSTIAARVAAAITGLALGVGLGLESVVNGDPASVLVSGIMIAGLALAIVALQPGRWMSTLVALVLLGFGLRVAAAATIFASSAGIGHGGFVTGDDAGYAVLAWSFVLYVRGTPQPPHVPPYWNGDEYLFGPFVYLESAVFFVFGQHAVLVEIVNAALLMAAALLLFDICRRAFSDMAAIVTVAIVAFYPSLILWSALNLKDAMIIIIVVTALWALLLAHVHQQFRYTFLAIALLIPLRGLRVYAYLGLGALIPVATLATRSMSTRMRIAFGSAGAILLAVLIAGIPGFLADPITHLDNARRNNALGARTSFVAPAAVEAHAGDTFVVIAPPDVGGTPAPDVRIANPSAVLVVTPPPSRSPTVSATPTGSPTPAPSVVVVAPGTRIVLAPASGPSPSAEVNTVFVHAGDVVFVSGSSATLAPASDRKPLPLFDRRKDQPAAELASGPDSEALVFARTIDHIPTGIAHALFAPFVWESRGASELAGGAENVLWYPLMPAAIATCWRQRSRWRLYLPTALACLGYLCVLALAEGNVGSLFRHRAMVVPLVALLASPTIVEVARRVADRRSATRTA